MPLTLAVAAFCNIARSDKAIPSETPNQSKLLEAQAFEISDEKLQQVRSAMRTAAGPEELDRIMQERGLDAIIAPMDSPIATLAALSGKRFLA